MAKNICSLLIIFLLVAFLTAQPAEQPTPTIEDLQVQIQAMSDSLVQLREQEIFSEYNFKDTDKLADVATKLQITNLQQWKTYLEIEPENEVLNEMSLRKLGISPYRAFLAQQYSIFGFTELNTLSELAQQKNIPIKQLRQFAQRAATDKSFDSYSLQALGIKPDQLVDFEKRFNAGRLKFGLSITLAGILIVFSALAVTALVISQLRHLNKKPPAADRKIVLDGKGKVISQPEDLNSNVIAAIITALHLHKQNIEDRRLLMLTFKRVRSNQWHGTGLSNMPNRDILRKRS